MKKVSVIIPLYNRAKLICETIGCLSSELHPDVLLEVIVVDDGSTDGGAELIKNEFPWVKLYHQSNQGAPTARNRGLSESTGDYILLLDSDDLIEKNFFYEKIKVLEGKSQLAAVYGPWDTFKVVNNEKIILPRHTEYPIEKEPLYDIHLSRLLEGWYIIPHAILWRRNILINVLKGFDPALIINQDVELLFRLLLNKYNIEGVNAPKALYREHHEGQRTGSITNSNKLICILELRKKFYSALNENGCNTTEFRKSLSKFCFNYWKAYRSVDARIAEDFYQLSRQIYPNIKLNGGILYQYGGKILGARRMVILKSNLISLKNKLKIS